MHTAAAARAATRKAARTCILRCVPYAVPLALALLLMCPSLVYAASSELMLHVYHHG